MKNFIIALASIVTVILLLGSLNISYNNRYDKDLAITELQILDIQHQMDLLESRCAEHGVNVNLSDLRAQRSKDNIENIYSLEELKSILEKETSVRNQMYARYLKELCKSQTNIKKIVVTNSKATISFLQLCEENGKRYDKLHKVEMDILQATSAIEDGLFEYGLTVEHISTIKIASNVEVAGSL